MAFTDDDLSMLNAWVVSVEERRMTKIGALELEYKQVVSLLDRLDAAERAVVSVVRLHKRCEDFAANPYPKIYGLDHEVGGNLEACHGCDAVAEWAESAGKTLATVATYTDED